MTSIPTVSETGKNYFYNNIVTSLNQEMQNLTYEISTGQKAQTYSDLGTQVNTALSLTAQNTQLNGYIAGINDATLNTDQMDTAMTGVTNDLNNVVSQFDEVSQGSGTPNLAVLQSTAQTALADIYSQLNSTVSGKYVFGADQTNTAPVASTSAAGTAVSALTSTYGGGNAASIITSLNGLTDTQLGYSTTLAAAGNVTVQADTNQNLNYTVKADEPQFQQAITGLNEIISLTYNAGDPTDFWSLFNDAKSRLTTANNNVSLRQGQLGVVRNQMASLLTSHQSMQTTLSGNIGNIENADLATASSQLQTLQTQIQATYSTIARVSQLSILNYLPAPS